MAKTKIPQKAAWKLEDHKTSSAFALNAAYSWAVFAEVLLLVMFLASAITAAAVGINTFGEDASIESPVGFWVLFGAAVQLLLFTAVMSMVRSFLSHKRHDRCAEVLAETIAAENMP